jgi:hypothetical protein
MASLSGVLLDGMGKAEVRDVEMSRVVGSLSGSTAENSKLWSSLDKGCRSFGVGLWNEVRSCDDLTGGEIDGI